MRSAGPVTMRATTAAATVIVTSLFVLTILVQGLDHVKFGASRVIQPNPCGHERTGEEGVCMFAWDCLNLNGTHITFCRDRFYYGSCCKLPDGVQAPNRMPPSFHNPPSNHLDASTRRPPFAQTTKDSVELPFDKNTGTARPPAVEVQFPRDATPRPTIPPAVPTLYPIVPPTTQRRPIVVNNHHKKPGYPLKGTTISPTPRPRPTEEVTTMAITDVPTGKPTWIIADEADKNGHPTLATPETTATPMPTSQPISTEQAPSGVTTTEIAPPAATMTVHPSDTETTSKRADEFSQAPSTPLDVITMQSAELTTDATSHSNPARPTASPEENWIDVTTEAETTTRVFSTRYPIRFPPKDKPTTTTKAPEITRNDEYTTTNDELTIQSVTMSTIDAAIDTTTTLKAEEGPDGMSDYPTSIETSSEKNADTSNTEAPPIEANSQPIRATMVSTNEVITTLAPSTSPSTVETMAISTDDATTTAKTILPLTESRAPLATTTIEVSSAVPDKDISSNNVTTTIGPVQTPETTTPTPETTTEYDPIKSICGRPKSFATGRIVGGDITRFGKWPWMISLRQYKKNTFVHKCGAALLNEYWAVSAAHCVHNVSPNDILLRLGEYDLSGHDKEPLGHIERRVQIVATHPKFDAHTFEYDLALMRFYEPVSFADNIVPICIAEGNKTYVGQSAVVTGWGRLYEDGPLPSILQKVQVPIITNKECERMYRKAGFIEDIPDIFICAGLSSGGKDSCEGDSGGPLVLKDEDSGAWNLIGIISWGIGCALPNQPGVYTRITKFSDWMKQIIVF
ncbi:hypothetical protein BIW11_00270 [Tropilaelaps mercedesae]|uniref:Peptidase S1 domain-containing protein n=1 Tax=Tropilaelaps mercedesae TaxID=418985 RepID=A0A1V9XYS6_9ACAR|nr:hypothetical protein BIW11_00270 [Tropilaelaps mercedesae]